MLLASKTDSQILIVATTQKAITLNLGAYHVTQKRYDSTQFNN
jgi:hypothetical protein